MLALSFIVEKNRQDLQDLQDDTEKALFPVQGLQFFNRQLVTGNCQLIFIVHFVNKG